MTEHERIIADIEKYGIAAAGRAECIKLHRGEKVNIHQAVKARCYECMGYYSDGAKDCEMPECELYAWMPFGETWKNREKRPMTEARLAALAEARKKKTGQLQPE